MTPYEIIDAQVGITQQITHSFRWWVSITFAAVVAAYAAGPQLAGAACALIVVLYTIISLSTLVTQNLFMRMARALGDEALAYQERSTPPSKALEQMITTQQRGSTVIRIQFVVRGVMFIATIGYILYRAGYLG